MKLNSKYFYIIPAICALSIIAPKSSLAGKSKDLLLDYDIYAGGIKILAAELNMSNGKDSYAMNLNAHTQGFIGALFPWSAEYNTSGVNKDGKLQPTSYEKSDTWRGGTKVTKMKYDEKGQVVKSTVEEGQNVTEASVDKLLSGNAVDVLTGVLNMMQIVKNSNECNGKVEVFDGKRKFNINLKNEGKEKIEPSRYSIFSGEAIKCDLTVEPIAGFKEKDKNRGWMAVQNHSEEHNRLPTIWLASTEKSAQLIPVRLQLNSTYGAVIAHLAKEEIK